MKTIMLVLSEYGLAKMVCHMMSWEQYEQLSQQCYIEHDQGDNWSRKKEMDENEILTHSELMTHLEIDWFF